MDQAELLAHTVEAFHQAGARYAITGSQASIAYGEVRFTNDIDILTDLTIASLPGFLRQFPAEDFYVSEDAATMAIAHAGQSNIIHPTSAQNRNEIARLASQLGLDDVGMQVLRELE